MESINDVLTWLTDHESAFSAIAALVVIFGVVLSPLGAGIRNLLTGRGNSKQNEVATSTATETKETDIPTTQDFLNTPPPLITDKPSIAVLPFVNMSDDKSQEYFADGMTEDIITGLSCDSRLFVIARNSTFAYKGQSPDIRTVGKELGVRYVLEGSIRPVAERLRITVQLIETETGSHIWADKIDRPVAEIFDIQDEVVDSLVSTLCANVGVAESDRAKRQRPEDLQAWALCVQAEVLAQAQPSSETVEQGEKLARRAAKIEPGYAASWAFLSFTTSVKIPWGLSTDLSKDSEAALALISKALTLAPNDPVVLGYCGYAAIWAAQAAQAINYLERSLAINPNNSFARFAYGAALNMDARPREAISQLELFLRRSPKDPYIGVAYFFLSIASMQSGDYQHAEQAALNGIKHAPGFGWAYLDLAMCLAAQGRETQIPPQMQKVSELAPSLSRQTVEDFWRHVVRKPAVAEMYVALAHQAFDA